MNFLGKLEASLKPKEEKKKKVYGEADIEGFDASIFNLPDSMQADVAEVQAETATDALDDVPEEPDDTTDDLPEPEYEEPADYNEDNEFAMDEETDADAGYTEEGTEEDENMFAEGEDEDTPEFRRKARKLNKSFSLLYDQYKDLIQKLKDIDATGDKATVLNIIINEYENQLQALVDYVDDNDDTWVIRFQTFVEFRLAFVTLNKKLSHIQEDVNILQ
mgnify:CR=1 FL=1